MTNEATRLMAEALERVTVGGSFSPAEVGAGVGLDRLRAEAAARALSDAGVLDLGFDCAAAFTPAFRKAHAAKASADAAAAAAGRKAVRRK